MTKLDPSLKRWIKARKEDIRNGTWIVGQHDKRSKRSYEVGVVKDFVYAYDNPEYLHIILKIKGNPNKRSGWGSRGWVYKLYYMTNEGKVRRGEYRKRLSYGQRPIVTGAGVFRKLMLRAKKKHFF